MVSKELLDYIKSVREKGFTDDAIRAHLIKFGYTDAMVAEAFNEAVIPAPSSPPMKPVSAASTKKPLDKRLLLIPAAVIIIIVIGLFIFFIGNRLYFSSVACSDVSVKIYELSDEPVICVYPDNSKAQMIIENDGKIAINGAEINLVGEKGTVTEKLENLDLPAPPAEQNVFTRVVEYRPEYGTVKRIEVIPTIIKDNGLFACNAKKVTVESIKTC